MIRLKSMIIIFILTFSVSGCLSGSGLRSAQADIFDQACGYYLSGDYDKAILNYQKLIAQGIESGAVYYNLGNSFIKKGEVGKAILSYTRARRYIPRDSDLLANERHARSLMKQPDSRPREYGFVTEVLRLFSTLNLTENIVIFFMLYYLLAALIGLVAIWRRARLLLVTFALIVGAAIVITVIPLIDKIYFAENGAITVVSVTDAKSEPYDEAPTVYPVYSGMKVYLLKEGLGWVKVIRPDGRIGWVPEKSVSSVW